MKKLKPEDQIPESFWMAIQEVQSDVNDFHLYLAGLERQAMVKLFQCFLRAKTELSDILVNCSETKGASEDTIDDLADAVIAQGRDVYLGIYYGKRKIPERYLWEAFKRIGHVFASVYYERFEQNIYDVWDE